MKNALVNSRSIVGGLLASACCIGPLLASLLSIGGLAFATAFEPYRPYFMVVTGIFLLGGFYFAYRPEKVKNEEIVAALGKIGYTVVKKDKAE